MDTRVGYPNEHLAGDTDKSVTSPLYATAVGLVMDGLHRLEKNEQELNEGKSENDEHVAKESENDETSSEVPKKENNKVERESFLDKLTKNLQDFLDNAE
jgi:cell division protein FtsA